MDARAWPVLILLILGGCSSSSSPEAQADVNTDEPVTTAVNGTTAAPDEGVPAAPPVRGNTTVEATDFWIEMDGCMEYDFQAPVVDKAPEDSWYPEGASPAFLVPGTAAYAFFLLECEKVLVDNRTLYEDGHYVVVEAGVTLAEDDPYATSLDQLHIQAFTDVPEIRDRMTQEGFRVELAEFSHATDVTMDSWSFFTEDAAVEIAAVKPGTDGGPPGAPDARLHSVSHIDGKHIYYDFQREGDANGYQQEYPRPAVSQVSGLEIDGPTRQLVGAYSENALHINLRVPIWER